MLRLIRVAAALGLFLSAASFVLAVLDWRSYVTGQFLESRQYFKEGLEHLLTRLHGPSAWFALAGILYVLAVGTLKQDKLARDQQASREEQD